MYHSDAAAIAQSWIDRLAPYCQRIEVAGSLRRSKPEVKDIEIVAIPIIKKQDSLFEGLQDARNLLVDALVAFALQDEFKVVKGKEKYKQLALPEGINLDLFMVTQPAQWGVIFTIRTGPAEFSHYCVTKKHQGGRMPAWAKVQNGAVWNRDESLDMPEEQDFFDFLQLPWIEPRDRKAPVLFLKTHGYLV